MRAVATALALWMFLCADNLQVVNGLFTATLVSHLRRLRSHYPQPLATRGLHRRFCQEVWKQS